MNIEPEPRKNLWLAIRCLDCGALLCPICADRHFKGETLKIT